MEKLKTIDAKTDAHLLHNLRGLINQLKYFSGFYHEDQVEIRKKYSNFKIFLTLSFSVFFYSSLNLISEYGFLPVFLAILTPNLLLLFFYQKKQERKIKDRAIKYSILKRKVFQDIDMNVSKNIDENKEYIEGVVGKFLSDKKNFDETVDSDIINFLERVYYRCKNRDK